MDKSVGCNWIIMLAELWINMSAELCMNIMDESVKPDCNDKSGSYVHMSMNLGQQTHTQWLRTVKPHTWYDQISGNHKGI